MDQPTIIIISIALPVFAFLVYLGFALDKKRRKSIEEFALSHGLEFIEKVTEGPLMAVMESELARQGRNQRIRNAVVGQINDNYVAIFDFIYIAGGDRNSSRHVQSVLMMPAVGQVPGFRIKPETIFHQIGDKFSKKDIDFDRYPEFSKKFVLKGDDENLIRAYFNDTRIRHLESWDGISLESINGRLIYFRYGQTLKISQYEDFIEECMAFHKLL